MGINTIFMPTKKSKNSEKTAKTQATEGEDAAQIIKKRKRKKRSPDEKSYTKNPKSKTSSKTEPHTGFFGRAATEQFIKDETGTVIKDTSGNPVPLKIAMLINEKDYRVFDLAELDKVIFDECSKHPVFRPISEVIQTNPTTGSPQKVVTPTKNTVLHRTKSFGAINFYSNDPTLIPIEELKVTTSVDPVFFQTPIYQAVVIPTQAEKSSSVDITQTLLRKTRREIAETSGRGKSQNTAMARPGVKATGSGAPSYTQSAKIMMGTDTEYAHHIPYIVLGPDAQKEENLSITSAHTNTDQLITYESMLKYLAKEYASDKIALHVKSELIDKTQISRKLSVTLKTPHHSYSFEFDPQNVNKPHIFQHHSFKILMKSTVQQAKENKMTTEDPLTQIKTGALKLRLFYTYQPSANTQEPLKTHETQPTSEAVLQTTQPSPDTNEPAPLTTQLSPDTTQTVMPPIDVENDANETHTAKKPKP